MDESLQKLHDLLKLNNQQQLPSKEAINSKCVLRSSHIKTYQKSEILPLFSNKFNESFKRFNNELWMLGMNLFQ